MNAPDLNLLALAGAAVALLSISPADAQDRLHVAGESNIGSETLAAVADGADFVAKVPNSGGRWSAAGGEGVVSSNLISPSYTVPIAGPITLTFSHRYNFEDDGNVRWDAGAVFIDVNGEGNTYLDGSAFAQNGYDGFGAGGDGRMVTANCPPIGAAEPDGKFGFNNTSTGFEGGTVIESIATVGTFAAGDTISVTFTGAWDEGFVQAPAPNWEIATFAIAGAAGPVAEIDFAQGPAAFGVSNVGGVAGPWRYAGAPSLVFEVDADTLTADRFVADPAGAGTYIDLNGARLIVEVAGTLDVGDSFQLFAGGEIRGSYGSLTLPEGQWDLSGLEPGGDGTITYASNALSGWLVRDLDVVSRIGTNVNSLRSALDMLTDTATARFVLAGDRTGLRPILDLAGEPGNFGVNDLYPGSPFRSNTARDDFIIDAKSKVTIPAGTWSIAIGSGDGGLIHVPGADFSTGANGGESRFGEDATPVRPGIDSARFEGKRDHGWTGGTFVLTEPLTTTINAIMFERGGGDSVEVAIRDASGGIDNDPTGNATGWALLEDGLHRWTVRSGTTTLERGEAIHVGGLNSVRPQSITTSGAELRNALNGPDISTPGLTQEWWQLPAPASKGAFDEIFASRSPDIPPFKGDCTWWTGSGNAIPGILAYPPATSPLSRDNYIARLSGEILIPASGDIRFKDGVDDFLYLAIDLNGNGIVGELDDGTGQSEVLVEDNNWTNVEGGGNIGSQIATRTFSVPAGGDWLAVEVDFGQGSGGDNAVLYWDYGGGGGFPASQTDGIDLINDAAGLLVPDSHLRSTFAPLLSADLVVYLERLPYEFEILADGSHDTLTVTNPNPSVFETVLDLGGAHIRVIFPGEAPPINTIVDLFDGAAIEGDYASLTLPPGNWDTSGLAPGGDGTITLVSGTPFRITAISHDGETDTATLTFNSRPLHQYAVDRLQAGLGWDEIVDDVDSGGDATTWTDDSIPTGTNRRVYRVRDLGMPDN